MANQCCCGRRHIPAESMRFMMDADLYLEWDKDCPNKCGDKETITLTNSETGETRDFTYNQFWEMCGGGPDQVGLMTFN